MGTLAFNIGQLDNQNGALPRPIRQAAAEILTAAEAAGHHIPAVSWFNPASTPEHHVLGFAGNGGVAVDFMVYGDVALQDWLDRYVWTNRARLGVCWLISRRRIRSTSPGHDGQWTRYTGPSAHADHSHVNFGRLAGTNGSTKLTKITYKAPGGTKAPAPPATGAASGYPEPSSRVVYCDKLVAGQQDSDSVWWVQKALGVALTGTYDPATLAAARAFQKVLGDDEDGELGPLQTRALLDRAGLTQVTVTVHS